MLSWSNSFKPTRINFFSMEFHGYDIRELLPGHINLISVDNQCNGLIVQEVKSDQIENSKANWSHSHSSSLHLKDDEWKLKQKQLSLIIDELGYFSGSEQKLKAPVTSTAKLLKDHHRVYILRGFHNERPVMMGLLKVANKKLFLSHCSQLVEKTMICVMDFHIVHKAQRRGHGLKLFNLMLKVEKVEPQNLAYDAPSPKLLSFLKKHFALQQPLRQANHFVVYKNIFK